MSDAVAAQIRSERAAARLTLEEVAARSGIPYPTYRKLDDGRGVADSAQILRLCGVYGISLSEFFARVEARLSPNDASGTERHQRSG